MKKLTAIRPRFWVAMACAMLCAGAVMLQMSAGSGLESQTAAQRWQAGDLKYSQVSAFISEDALFTDNAVPALRQAVDEFLAAAALEPEGEDARLWLDTYSAETAVTVEYGDTTQSVRATCTGRDFFHFHPLEMATGWYYTGTETSDALVVLDEALAWKLFGSVDAVGLELYINGYACTVSGVVKTPQNKDEQAAYGEEPTLYVPYSFLTRQEGGTLALTCYEAVLPEAVSGFALETVENALGLPEGQYELRQNTGRFRFGRSLQIASEYDTRAQRTGRIYYPWWENAARAAESRAALLAVLILILGIYPVIYIIWAGIHYGRQSILNVKLQREMKGSTYESNRKDKHFRHNTGSGSHSTLRMRHKRG